MLPRASLDSTPQWVKKGEVVGAEIDGVMQLEIWAGALEDGFRRRQAGGGQPFRPPGDCGLHWGGSSTWGDKSESQTTLRDETRWIRPVLIRQGGVRG